MKRADRRRAVARAMRKNGTLPPRANPLTGRPGPVPNPPRDGDKIQARQRVNLEVKSGRLPHPNSLPCSDCGHVWVEGERRHEYDHHRGYGAAHHLDVEPVCTRCHSGRDNARAKATCCIRGHAFDAENTGRKTNGTRFCRECHRIFDRGRHDAAYWREYRSKKRAGRLLDGVLHDGRPA